MNSLFVSENVRDSVNDGRADYVPIFLSEIPLLFKRNILPVDVALVQASPPDKHGYCSLGVSVDIASTAVKTARYVIAQVNSRMPRTLGDGIIHRSEFDALVPRAAAHDEISLRIGSFCAELVDDGPFLKPGAGVVTTRAHAHYIVTEYGVAYLYGKNMRQRAKALIEIAHPNHREALEEAAFERFRNYEFERTYY